MARTPTAPKSAAPGATPSADPRYANMEFEPPPDMGPASMPAAQPEAPQMVAALAVDGVVMGPDGRPDVILPAAPVVDEVIEGGYFLALTSIVHNGQHYETGTTLRLTGEQAAPILEHLERVEVDVLGNVMRHKKPRRRVVQQHG